jgi:hypothetical protein
LSIRDLFEPEYLFHRIIIGGILICIVLLLYFIHRLRNRPGSKRLAILRYQPEYARVRPKKQGDYYTIVSLWSTDRSSNELIVHNVNPTADNAKMVITKTSNGYFMRMFDRNGNLMQENGKITTAELATIFMEMRHIPDTYQKQPIESHTKSRTLEFK